MKKLILMGAGVAGWFAQSALAAEVPIEPPVYPVPAIVARVFHWTGFYVGANVGYGWGHGNADVIDPIAGVAALGLSENARGIIGGGQIGANWQTGNAVFGIEADIQGSGQSASSSASGLLTVINPDGSLGVIGVSGTNADKITSFGTLRGRVGMAADRWLFYLTGGGAYGTWRSDLNVIGIGTGSIAKSRGGGVIGAGVEVAIADNLTVKAEYLHLQFGTLSANPLAAAPALAVSARLEDDIVRVGVNYLFTTGSVGCRPHSC